MYQFRNWYSNHWSGLAWVAAQPAQTLTITRAGWLAHIPAFSFLWCSNSGLKRFLRREGEDLAPVNHARVVSDRDYRFSVRTLYVLLPLLLRHLESRPAAHASSVDLCWGVFHPFQVDFLHSLQLLRVELAVTRSVWALTYLVLRLNVPLWVLQELIDVLSKHLFKVSVVYTALGFAPLVLSATTHWLWMRAIPILVKS